MTRCIRCNRTLFAPVTVTVTTKGGTRSYGPVCARKAGLLEKQPKRAAAPQIRNAVTADDRQIDWLEAIAA